MIDQHISNNFIEGWDEERQEYNDQEEVKAEDQIVEKAVNFVKDDGGAETGS